MPRLPPVGPRRARAQSAQKQPRKSKLRSLPMPSKLMRPKWKKQMSAKMTSALRRGLPHKTRTVLLITLLTLIPTALMEPLKSRLRQMRPVKQALTLKPRQ